MCLGGIKYSFEVQILYFPPQLEAVFILEQGGLTVAISTEPEHHAAGPEQERGGHGLKLYLGPVWEGWSLGAQLQDLFWM